MKSDFDLSLEEETGESTHFWKRTTIYEVGLVYLDACAIGLKQLKQQFVTTGGIGR